MVFNTIKHCLHLDVGFSNSVAVKCSSHSFSQIYSTSGRHLGLGFFCDIDDILGRIGVGGQFNLDTVQLPVTRKNTAT